MCVATTKATPNYRTDIFKGNTDSLRKKSEPLTLRKEVRVAQECACPKSPKAVEGYRTVLFFRKGGGGRPLTGKDVGTTLRIPDSK